jgi:hypothetical protein
MAFAPAECSAFTAGPFRRRLADVGELADAGDALLASGEVLRAGGERRIDLPGDPAAADRLTHPAAALDLLENAPRLFRNLVGEPVEVPTAAGRVDHPV